MSDNGLLARDAAARLRALDVAGSFIVRAPAGSGKTELLIQRVLALLATVDAPEQVVAITFTRKAAAEMKQRLLDALQLARNGAEPDEPHQQRTWSLARVVCARDSERGWNIEAAPTRLRVQTIDALSQWFARQLPMALGLGAAPQVTEDAEHLYVAAARATIRLIDSPLASERDTAADLARVLVHLDNDIEHVVALLAAMLERRDQWLRHLGGQQRAELEAALQRACERHMRRICELMPPDLINELVALARYAAANGGAAGALSPCVDLTDLPEASIGRLDAWRALASMLLTQQGAWRARFTKTEGFPPGASKVEKDRARRYQERIRQLMERLAGHDELRAALHALRSLPPPRYSDVQWDIVQAITGILPRAAAELEVSFAEAGVMDFTEVTRRAVRALADEHATDLAATMDARVQHLLVDEFQDTSVTQFELIEHLVSHWTPGDGRTLFVVGDPMQSIYRFREAEVGLFLRAWDRGVGPVSLEPLRLARNFRSQQGIVEWVNRAFERVLPTRSDLASGAVSFEPAVAVHAAAAEAAVTVHPFVGGTALDEARRVVDIVQAIRANDSDASIALLVRARTHLTSIAVALRRAGLRPTAVELDVLATRPLIIDLLSLTRALEHRADRVAWLGVLRAPWCGLTLRDIAALAEGEAGRSIGDLLQDAARIERLSADGRARAARVGAVVARAEDLRGRMTAAQRVEQTWLLLGGSACIEAAEHVDAQRFFDHLSQHEAERAGRVDVAVFEQSLWSLYATPDEASDPTFQVMTIHKAKGLEFDHVIVPGLASAPRRDEAQLMVWLERVFDNGSELLLAPIDAGGSDKDALVRWVEEQGQERQRHEDERLAYVAATRARRRLHWLAWVGRDSKGRLAVPDASLLARLWPALGDDFERAEPIARSLDTMNAPVVFDQSLRRLPAGWSLPQLPASVQWAVREPSREALPAVEFSWAGETARRIGIVVHRWLQRIAEDGSANWNVARVSMIAPQIERALAAGGLTGPELLAARTRVAQALVNVLEDERGRWILGSHPEQRSELRLTVADGARARRIVLDRTFVTSDGTRWIVDYKVGVHEGTDVQRFLDAEQMRYRAQLESYAAAVGPAARLGLYFPLVTGWREWSVMPATLVNAPPSADNIRSGGPPRTEVP